MPPRSNDTQKVIHMYYASMPFFPVFAYAKPRSACTVYPVGRSLEKSFEGSIDPRSRPFREVPINVPADHSVLSIFPPSPFDFPVPPSLFRINTCKVYQNKHFNPL